MIDLSVKIWALYIPLIVIVFLIYVSYRARQARKLLSRVLDSMKARSMNPDNKTEDLLDLLKATFAFNETVYFNKIIWDLFTPVDHYEDRIKKEIGLNGSNKRDPEESGKIGSGQAPGAQNH